MDYTKYMKTSRNGLFVPDYSRPGIRIPEPEVPIWVYPGDNLSFLKLKFGYYRCVKRPKYQPFLVDKDRIILDLLSNTDTEYLMENKQFMKEFEISYRFLKSLGLDERYY